MHPRPIPRRLRPADRMRLARRLAAGMSVARTAQAEGMGVADVEALLADGDFADLVEASRELDAMPEAEAAERLVSLARFCIEDAIERGNWAAGLFVLREHERGRYAPRTIARGVVAARRRATRAAAAAAEEPASPPPVLTPAPSRPPRPAPHPGDRAAWGAAARLRAAVTRELAARRGTTAEAPAPPSPRPSPMLRTGEGARATDRRARPLSRPGGMGEGRGEGGSEKLPTPAALPQLPSLPGRLAARLAGGTALGAMLGPAAPEPWRAPHASRPPPPPRQRRAG